MIVSSTHRTRQWSLVMLPRFQHGGIIDEIIIKLTSVLLCFMLCNLVLALMLAGCMQLRSPDCCAFLCTIINHASEATVALSCPDFAILSLGGLDNAFSFQQQACNRP